MQRTIRNDRFETRKLRAQREAATAAEMVAT